MKVIQLSTMRILETYSRFSVNKSSRTKNRTLTGDFKNSITFKWRLSSQSCLISCKL